MRATILLGGASAAVAFLPFRRSIRFGLVPVRGSGNGTCEEILWAVAAAARRVPYRSACIEQGLVVQRLLRSAGFRPVLHYGARHHPATDELEAHVWVTLDGQAVVGGEEAPHFALVASYS